MNTAPRTGTREATAPWDNDIRRAARERKTVPGARGVLALCALALGLFLAWASWAELDELARGFGQVIPSQRVQSIQNLEGGILQALLVTEGQVVEQGTLLLRIDNETADSRYREALVRSLELQATIARLEAAVAGTEPEYPPEVRAVPELMRRQNDILDSARRQFAAEAQVLRSQRKLRLQEAEEQRERRSQLAVGLELAERQRELARPALKARAYSALEFLNLEQKVQSLKTEIATLDRSIPRLLTSAREVEDRLRLQEAEQTARQRREISEAQTRLRSLQELIAAGSDTVRRTEVRSPVHGTVKKIYSHTEGGVVAPGATIMDIVPLDDALIIETRFNPADIAFLYPGQPATVRLSAYDFSIYGGLEAVVEHISADTLEGRQGEAFYLVKVRTGSRTLRHKGGELPIRVGMMAEVDVLTGKKTVLEYLLKPLIKARRYALRER